MSALPSPFRDQIVELLKAHESLSIHEIARFLNRSPDAVEGTIRQTRKNYPNLVFRIVEYKRCVNVGKGGKPTPMYAAEPGRDVPRPKRLSTTVYQRNYRNNLKSDPVLRLRNTNPGQRPDPWLLPLLLAEGNHK